MQVYLPPFVQMPTKEAYWGPSHTLTLSVANCGHMGPWGSCVQKHHCGHHLWCTWPIMYTLLTAMLVAQSYSGTAPMAHRYQCSVCHPKPFLAMLCQWHTDAGANTKLVLAQLFSVIHTQHQWKYQHSLLSMEWALEAACYHHVSSFYLMQKQEFKKQAGNLYTRGTISDH